MGLGATLYPLDEAAKFLVGYKDGEGAQDCTIVDASWSKSFDMKTISPVKDMIYTTDEEVDDEPLQADQRHNNKEQIDTDIHKHKKRDRTGGLQPEEEVQVRRRT